MYIKQKNDPRKSPFSRKPKPRLLSIKTFKCIVLSLYLDNLIVKTCHASKFEYWNHTTVGLLRYGD